MIFRSPYPDVQIPEQSLTELICQRAVELGDKPALIEGLTAHIITYKQLAESIRKVAASLAVRGFSKGDVLAIYSYNLPEYAIAFHAVATLGGIITTANPSYTAQELIYQLNDTKAKYLLTVPELIEPAQIAASQSKVEEIFVFGSAVGATPFSVLLEGNGQVPQVQINPREDLVLLPYSSGTTGLPKGVMHTHYSLLADIYQFKNCEGIAEADTIIGVLPFFHIYFLLILNQSLFCGATIVTLPRFSLDNFLALIQKHKITRAHLVPPIVLALAKQPLVENYDLSSLQVIMSAGSPLNDEVAKECEERLNCVVKQQYGLTETGCIFMNPDEPDKIKPGSVGHCIRNTECQIVDIETGKSLCAHQVGELWIRGSQVMKGYLNNPEATAKAIDGDGWFHTGDIGYADEDGYFYIVDRIKELIKYNGYAVAPAELEDILLTHPVIADAAVIPSPHPSSGEVPKAFVVLEDESKATPEEIIEFVAAQVAPHKRIRRLEIVEQIPKSAAGKILRHVLVQQELKKINEETEKSEVIAALSEFRQQLEAAPASQRRSLLMAHVCSLVTQVLELGSSNLLNSQQGLVNLGMDSLMAVQLRNHLETSLKCRLPSTLAFDYPTVQALVDFLVSQVLSQEFPLLEEVKAELSNLTEVAPQAVSWQPSFQDMEFDSLPPITPASLKTHIPLSQVQQLIWKQQQLHPDSCAYHVPMAVHFTGSLFLEVLEKSLNEMLRRHEILRTTFAILDGQPVIVWTKHQSQENRT